jgi:hypothetical protein
MGMNCTVFTTIFGGISILWLAGGFLFFQKNENPQVAVSWLGLVAVILNCFHCLVAAILNPLGIPVNIVTIGIADLVAGSFFWYKIIKQRRIQRYRFSAFDAVFVLLAIAGLAGFAKIRYGGFSLDLNYLTIDPACHLQETVNFVRTQSVSGMFYEFVWNGIFVELLAPFSQPDYYYRYFVLSDLINLGLAAFVFYGIARRHTKDRYGKTAALILALAYMVGYPLCSTLYGFTYLGMGVTVVGAIMLACDMLTDDEMPLWLNVIVLMLGCMGIIECYALFAPVVFFAVISCVFVRQKRAHKLVSKSTVVLCLSIFLIPCIIGIAYTYAHIFMENQLSVGTALNNEGACYRDLYSNFLFFLPAMVYAFWMGIRRKENRMILFLAPYSLLYTLYLLYKVLKGETSTYYYYKMYYLLWLVAFVLLFGAVTEAKREVRILAVGGFATWVLVAAVCVGHIEEKLAYHSQLLIPEVKSNQLCSIIYFNDSFMWNKMSTFSEERLELYHYVAQNIGQQGEVLVPLAGDWEDDYWYQAITNQRYYGWGQSEPDHTEYFSHLDASGAQYVVVLKDSTIYADETAYFDSLERVYENNIGFVGVLQAHN